MIYLFITVIRILECLSVTAAAAGHSSSPYLQFNPSVVASVSVANNQVRSELLN